MKRRKIPGFLFYIIVALFVLYFVLISIPDLDTNENQIYFKILFLVPFILLVISSFVNCKNNKDT